MGELTKRMDHPSPLRVAVADDGALFREGLVLLLKALGHNVVGAVDSGDKLLRLLANDPVDVAVLDIRMPPEPDGGLLTARRLRSLHPSTGLLLLSHYGEAHYLMEILKIGAHAVGYRLKDSMFSEDALSDTILQVAQGKMVIEPSVAQQLIRGPGSRPGELGALTDREMNVLRLMAEGHANARIAGQLFLSVKAVEKTVASIFTKLELPTDPTSQNRRVLAVLTYLRAVRTH